MKSVIIFFCVLIISLLIGYYYNNNIFKDNVINKSCYNELKEFSIYKDNIDFLNYTKVSWPQYNKIPRNQNYVVTPFNIQQIQQTLECATKKNLHAVVKSGGHDYAGYSQVMTKTPTTDFSISMQNFKEIKNITFYDNNTCNKGCMALEIGSGIVFEEIYTFLNNTDFILAGGLCPSVGVIPFHLGGGLGATNRLWGLGVDNLLSVSLVSHDGSKYITVNDNSSTQEEQDLFWALRGGGGTTFGIITSITVKLHSISEHYNKFNTSPSFVYGEYCIGEDDEDEMINELELYMSKVINIPNWLTIDWRLVYHNDTNNIPHKELCYLIYSMNSINNTRDTLYKIMGWENIEDKLPVKKPPYGTMIWSNDEPSITNNGLLQKYAPHYNFLHYHTNFLDMDLDNAKYKGYKAFANFPTYDWNWILPKLSRDMISKIVHHFYTAPSTKCGIQGMTLGGISSLQSINSTAFPFRENIEYVADAECEVDDISKEQAVKFVQDYINIMKDDAKGAYYNFPYKSLPNYAYNYWRDNLQKLKEIRTFWNPNIDYPLKFEQEIPLL